MRPVRLKVAVLPAQPDLLRSALDPLDPATWDAEGYGLPRRKVGARNVGANPRPRQIGATGKATSDLERILELHARVLKLPTHEREYRFHPVRMWRFDIAWPSIKLAAEVQGGIWVTGYHARGAGIEKDAEKLNEAALLGWLVLLFSPGHVRSGAAVRWIERALAMRQPQALVSKPLEIAIA